MEYHELRNDLEAVGARVAELLDAATSPDQPVAGSDWTVNQVAAHLVELTRRYRDAIGGDSEPFPRLDGSTHAGMAGRNARSLTPLRDTAVESFRDDAGALLDALGRDGERVIPWFETRATLHEVAGVWLGEMLLHGLDVARTLDRAWPISRAQAAQVFFGIRPMLPLVAREAVARSLAPATLHLKLRGEADYTVAVTNDGVTVEAGAPARPDVSVSASPVAYLLVGYGRKSQWAAIARGQITAWGRKPWLALKFAELFENP